MAFTEVMDLDCDVTTALGGRNKKTGKANPTNVEGYYLGSKTVESPRSKSGKAQLHILQTATGNLGVWGKTDLDRKMLSVSPGAMIRITQSGTVPTPNGDMYKFKVEVDSENTIEVALPPAVIAEESEEYVAAATTDDGYEEAAVDEEDEETLDEVAPARAVAPKKAVATPDAARQAKVKALLSGNRKAAS